MIVIIMLLLVLLRMAGGEKYKLISSFSAYLLEFLFLFSIRSSQIEKWEEPFVSFSLISEFMFSIWHYKISPKTLLR